MSPSRHASIGMTAGRPPYRVSAESSDRSPGTGLCASTPYFTSQLQQMIYVC
ncbi:hypothetical protein I553_0150 [Mycobacterium xenopi 4042]|uniref:Uncharacterized protein n=1 Tax=Mycobacterium xenopi 4042 TaxID=1299334 RepID=X7YI63_MYCXE|nr:hypothetical protein I553_0150 [Mycobacterium xenopi 4042]